MLQYNSVTEWEGDQVGDNKNKCNLFYKLYYTTLSINVNTNYEQLY